MTSEVYATLTALALLVAYGLLRRPTAPGPDSEELSGVRQGDIPPNGGVVSAPHSLDVFADVLSAHGVPETAELSSIQHPPGALDGRRTGAGRACGLDPCTITRLEQAPACDRAPDLLSDINNPVSGLSRRVVVRSTAAGAPAVLYSSR